MTWNIKPHLHIFVKMLTSWPYNGSLTRNRRPALVYKLSTFHFPSPLIIYQSVEKFLKYKADIYLLKVYNKKIKTMLEISSKLTKMTPERHHWRRSGVFIVNFEQISNIVLVFSLLFEQLNTGWDLPSLSAASLKITWQFFKLGNQKLSRNYRVVTLINFSL